MIEIGSKTEVNMDNSDGMSVIALLNKLGGEVVKEIGDKHTRIGYLVAYDEKHRPAIDRARELDARNGAGTIFFKTLGGMRPKEFPGDERYYLLAFEHELKPN